MFTTDPEIGEDATDLFNFLTGYSDKQDYNKLLVAPINLRQSLEAYVEAEIENAKKGERAHIIMKTNAVVDKRIIKLLYQASQAGVQIELFVRGICCLRPGVPGLSENISVVSILGRFLEHSRIYYFYNGGNEKIYLGSADAMPRNLDRRVEVTFPIENPKMIKHIRDNILGIYQRDNVRARVMNADGTYTRLTPKDGETPIDVQEWFLAERQG
jgi:polyphosphate kinase